MGLSEGRTAFFLVVLLFICSAHCVILAKQWTWVAATLSSFVTDIGTVARCKHYEQSCPVGLMPSVFAPMSLRIFFNSLIRDTDKALVRLNRERERESVMAFRRCRQLNETYERSQMNSIL
jgi:hypothetical protein